MGVTEAKTKCKIMKSCFYYLPIALMAFAFASCGEDDEVSPSGGQSQSAASSEIVTTNGEKILLTGIDGDSYYEKQTFTYDEQGRPKIVMEESDYGYVFSYNPFKVSFYDEDNSEEEDYEERIEATLNSRGYISSVSIEEKDEDEEGFDDIYKETVLLDYDSEGHLVKATGKWTETEYEDGKKHTESGTDLITFTWENGNLVRIEYKYEEEYDNEYQEDIYEITYGDQKNQYNQYTCGIANEFMGAISLVGMTGKGTAYLPISIKETYKEAYDDEVYEETYLEKYSYTLNSNGTIATETCKHWYNDSSYGYSDTYNYTYSTVGDTPAFAPVVKSNNIVPTQKSKKRHGFFGARRQRMGK